MRRATLPDIPRLWTIVLAAGASTRLGRPKQLISFRGMSLLSRALDHAESLTAGRTLVVLGADALRIRAHLRRCRGTIDIAYNAQWRSGMGTSLARAVAALPRSARAALVLLSDQPGIGPASLDRLVTAWRRHPTTIAASQFGGRLGVPAIFPRREFRTLKALRGDTGARDIIRNRGDIRSVAVPEAAFDVDTEQDLARLIAIPAASRTRFARSRLTGAMRTRRPPALRLRN